MVAELHQMFYQELRAARSLAILSVSRTVSLFPNEIKLPIPL